MSEHPGPEDSFSEVSRRLGLLVFERGWLSSNNVLFVDRDGPADVVDTGYVTHAEQTLALLGHGLGGRPLERIFNSHLHSDHCGGNAAIQARWPEVETWVPLNCLEAVQRWDEERLTYRLTDQRCDRFRASGSVSPGDEVELGGRPWHVHAAPGHDPTALMFFQPQLRVLISADALWEKRLAIVFPELGEEVADGFDACARTLDAIERLDPQWVIPGHGRPFSDVGGALRASRERVEAFARNRDRHRRHALRSLLMFRMMELGQADRHRLVDWARFTPITGGLSLEESESLVDSLVADGALLVLGEKLVLRT